MPGDDNNPFNDILVQLNGATFSSSSVLKIQGNSSLDGDQLTVNGIGTGQQFDPGQITVASYSYVPGRYQGDGYWYAPPHFGILNFSGIDGAFTSFVIIGFTEDGILLDISGSYIGYASRPNGNTGYILSLDGFSPGNFDFPVTFGYDPFVYHLDPVCFAEGTRIETIAGPVAVEALAIGDAVLTASGAVRPVKWVGHMSVRPSRHARPGEVHPVLVRAHAFGADMPSRDVRLSPGHAVFVDGVLVPVGFLVNGATIVQEEVEQVRYFHVELDSHDVLLAEGLPCESYLDDGNRSSFTNAGESVRLYGRLDPKSWDDACAPMIAAGPQLVEIQQRLHARAEALGWVRQEDAGLVLVADAVEIAPAHVVGNRYWFAVPAASELTLRSNSGVLGQVVPGLGDGRRLGVAVSRLLMDGEPVDLKSGKFGAGFYPAEMHGDHGWRWTDGNARLGLEIASPVMIEVELAMVAPSWSRAPLRVAA